MKGIIQIFKLLLLGFFIVITSCNKDFLETTPLTEFSEKSVWSDPALVETFINNIYWRLDEPFSSGRLKANLVDEGHYRGNAASLNFNRSLLTVDQIPGLSTPSRYLTWNDLYKSIRYCNIFFEKVGEVPFDNTIVDGKTLKERMTGEVHFLRGYLYHLLVRMYGGVPIITNAYELSDDFNAPRDTYSDCVNFIVAECDSAAILLPLANTGDNKGRATKGAALALKSRVLLYAASDLFNTQVFPGFSNPELIGYQDGNTLSRWQAAKDAAKAVIDLGIYSLYKADPAPGDSVAKNINEMFLLTNTEEDIFVKYFTVNSTENVGLVSGPNGWHNWGTNAPIQDAVDDYEMKDGTSFDWTNPSHSAFPYNNREPRFYANILYEGATWKPRTADVKPMDPDGKVQVGRWEKWDAANNTTVLIYGLDTRQSPIENWNGSFTGYYLRKYQDPAVDAQYFKQTVPWRWIRYGEIILNYVEACIELGQEDEARVYINMIRKRAGMPDITEVGDALKERYRHERRVELMFEDHRIWDVRRWVIGPQAYHTTHIADVVYKLNPDHTTATIPTISSKVFEQYNWLDKAYFFPILRDEMNKNSALIQNPGY
jgi:hypothetical protein